MATMVCDHPRKVTCLRFKLYHDQLQASLPHSSSCFFRGEAAPIRRALRSGCARGASSLAGRAFCKLTCSPVWANDATSSGGRAVFFRRTLSPGWAPAARSGCAGGIRGSVQCRVPSLAPTAEIEACGTRGAREDDQRRQERAEGSHRETGHKLRGFLPPGGRTTAVGSVSVPEAPDLDRAG